MSDGKYFTALQLIGHEAKPSCKIPLPYSNVLFSVSIYPKHCFPFFLFKNRRFEFIHFKQTDWCRSHQHYWWATNKKKSIPHLNLYFFPVFLTRTPEWHSLNTIQFAYRDVHANAVFVEIPLAFKNQNPCVHNRFADNLVSGVLPLHCSPFWAIKCQKWWRGPCTSSKNIKLRE
jgi:hypothetical protein